MAIAFCLDKFRLPWWVPSTNWGILWSNIHYHCREYISKSITSISFKSNIKTYGPYGLSNGGETHFRSGIGKIMGFWGNQACVLIKLEYLWIAPLNSTLSNNVYYCGQVFQPWDYDTLLGNVWIELHERLV
jgi:hypothetical protein